MRELTKSELKKIVSEFGHLTDRAYGDDFCWESDVGNTISPLGFAAYPAVYGDDLITELRAEAERHVCELYEAYPEEMENREFDQVVEDILRNVASDASDRLEDLVE